MIDHLSSYTQQFDLARRFYLAGLANGGQDNGAPGLRPRYHEHYFGAFLLDPDGNNVEARYHGAPQSEQTNEGDS